MWHFYITAATVLYDSLSMKAAFYKAMLNVMPSGALPVVSSFSNTRAASAAAAVAEVLVAGGRFLELEIASVVHGSASRDNTCGENDDPVAADRSETH